MTMYLGDFPTGQTIYIPWQTFDSNDPSASVTMTGLALGDIVVFKDGSVTQRSSTTGFTLLDTDGTDFDTRTGLHGISIDTSDNTDAGFFAAGSDYWVAIDSVTVDAGVIRFWAATFSIDNRGLLRPTTVQRTLDVTAAGEAGLDLDNTSGTLAAAQIATGAITAAKFAAGAIDAAAIATDAIGSAELAASAVTEIRDAVTGGAYALDTDANGAIRIVDGTGARELNTNAGAVALVDLVTTLTTYTGNTLQTGDVITAINDLANGTDGLGAIKADTAAVLLDTADIQPNYATSASIAALNDIVASDVWAVDATSQQTQGTFGQAIGDPTTDATTIYQAVATDAAGDNVSIDVIAVKAETALIVADTSELQGDWTNTGRLDTILDAIPTTAMRGTDSAALASVATETRLSELDAATGGKMANQVDIIQTDTTTDIPALLPTALVGGRMDCDVEAINNDATAADNLQKSALGIVSGAAVGTPTTTVIDTDLTEATTDHYKGRIVTFTTGAVLGQSSDITGYNGTTKELTVTALTNAPSAADLFVIT